MDENKCDGHSCPYEKVCDGCPHEDNIENQYSQQIGAYVYTMSGTLLEDNDIWAIYRGPTGKLIACRVDIHQRGRNPTQLHEYNVPPTLIRWTDGEYIPPTLESLVEKYRKE